MDNERQRFEQWYATHAFNYERDPIGSRDCGLQWAAWQAGIASERNKPTQDVAPQGNEVDCRNCAHVRSVRSNAPWCGIPANKDCVAGSEFVADTPIRLYATENKP